MGGTFTACVDGGSLRDGNSSKSGSEDDEGKAHLGGDELRRYRLGWDGRE